MDDFPNLPTKKYDQLRHEIKSGDLLLCSGSSMASSMIQKATQSVWSHVAFILRLDVIDRIMVLESVESIGVRVIPLSNYVRDYNATGVGYPGRMMLARHQDFKAEKIINLSKFAIDLLGYPYDTQEILRIAARITMGAISTTNNQPSMPTREFICSEYAYVCLKSVGVTIDYDPKGFIAPADFARSKKITALSFIESQAKIPVIEAAPSYTRLQTV